MVWFLAHWAPHVLQQLEQREQDYRQQYPQWFDRPVSRELEQKRQEANDCRTLQFQTRPDMQSPIHLLNVSLRVDWLSLPVRSLLETAQPEARFDQRGVPDQNVGLLGWQ